MRRGAALVLVVVMCGVGCRSQPSETTASAPPAPDTGTYDVDSLEQTFVDGSRNAGATPERTLRTVISFPARRGRPARGPFPVVLFSHGLGGAPEDYRDLIDGWVRDGFVVAAPAYPRTNRDAPDIVPQDLLEQPADARFVLTAVLELDSEDGHPLEGRLDEERVAAGGHSLGGMTTLGMFKDCCAERRLDAGIVLAGSESGFEDEPFADTSAPLLFLHGDEDSIVTYERGRDAYRQADEPKALVTLEGGSHTPPFVDRKDPYFDIVAATTLDLLRWTLRGDERARAALAGHGDEASRARFEGDL